MVVIFFGQAVSKIKMIKRTEKNFMLQITKLWCSTVTTFQYVFLFSLRPLREIKKAVYPVGGSYLPQNPWFKPWALG
jgi:hypothetical protein